MAHTDMARKNLIAQWAFDTRPILGRFHLWLEDVEVKWISGEGCRELRDVISFVGGGMERLELGFHLLAAQAVLADLVTSAHGTPLRHFARIPAAVA